MFTEEGVCDDYPWCIVPYHTGLPKMFKPSVPVLDLPSHALAKRTVRNLLECFLFCRWRQSCSAEHHWGVVLFVSMINYWCVPFFAVRLITYLFLFSNGNVSLLTRFLFIAFYSGYLFRLFWSHAWTSSVKSLLLHTSITGKFTNCGLFTEWPFSTFYCCFFI